MSLFPYVKLKLSGESSQFTVNIYFYYHIIPTINWQFRYKKAIPLPLQTFPSICEKLIRENLIVTNINIHKYMHKLIRVSYWFRSVKVELKRETNFSIEKIDDKVHFFPLSFYDRLFNRTHTYYT